MRNSPTTTIPIIVAFWLIPVSSRSFGQTTPERRPPPPVPCTATINRASDGLTVYSPNGKQILVNKPDAAGIFQLYVGESADSTRTCITCTQHLNSPAPNRHKLQPHWHPSGEWIVLAAEMASYQPPLFSTPAVVLGWLQSGLWVDIYATRPDGSEWHQLSSFGQPGGPDGYTGVAFTPDGKRAVWAQIVDGNIFKYPFGRWQLILADFSTAGAPVFTNLRDITPAGAAWIEPGNFAPDNKSLVFTADIDMTDPQGMDQFILDIDTGTVRNLTRSPKVWDEHGVFSPDGKKILFMSSYPFRATPFSNYAIFLKTEFMLMDSNGDHLEQLTHFNSAGYPESNLPNQGSVAANGEWRPDGKSISALNLFFPNYQTWSFNFYGRCEGAVRR